MQLLSTVGCLLHRQCKKAWVCVCWSHGSVASRMLMAGAALCVIETDCVRSWFNWDQMASQVLQFSKTTGCFGCCPPNSTSSCRLGGKGGNRNWFHLWTNMWRSITTSSASVNACAIRALKDFFSQSIHEQQWQRAASHFKGARLLKIMKAIQVEDWHTLWLSKASRNLWIFKGFKCRIQEQNLPPLWPKKGVDKAVYKWRF